MVFRGWMVLLWTACAKRPGAEPPGIEPALPTTDAGPALAPPPFEEDALRASLVVGQAFRFERRDPPPTVEERWVVVGATPTGCTVEKTLWHHDFVEDLGETTLTWSDAAFGGAFPADATTVAPGSLGLAGGVPAVSLETLAYTVNTPAGPEQHDFALQWPGPPLRVMVTRDGQSKVASWMTWRARVAVPPYDRAMLRRGFAAGAGWRFRVTRRGEDPVELWIEVVDNTAEAVTLASAMHRPGDGAELERSPERTLPWPLLREEMAFGKAEFTEVADDTVTVPAGTYDTWRFTQTVLGEVETRHYRRDQAGPPVLWTMGSPSEPESDYRFELRGTSGRGREPAPGGTSSSETLARGLVPAPSRRPPVGRPPEGWSQRRPGGPSPGASVSPAGSSPRVAGVAEIGAHHGPGALRGRLQATENACGGS